MASSTLTCATHIEFPHSDLFLLVYDLLLLIDIAALLLLLVLVS